MVRNKIIYKNNQNPIIWIFLIEMMQLYEKNARNGKKVAPGDFGFFKYDIINVYNQAYSALKEVNSRIALLD